jgi:large-conductance mechanosensitive channel
VGNIVVTWGDVVLQICAWMVFASAVFGFLNFRHQYIEKKEEANFAAGDSPPC